jgi:hypothetical protein
MGFLKDTCGLLFVTLAMLGGCQRDENQDVPRSTRDQQDRDRGHFFGGELKLFDGRREGEKIRVNPYLWQAALETLSFAGIARADLSMGLMETHWYSAPQAPQERLKVLVTVLNGRLRTDGLRTTVVVEEMRQGTWTPIVPSHTFTRDLEEAILTRARLIKSQAPTR